MLLSSYVRDRKIPMGDVAQAIGAREWMVFRWISGVRPIPLKTAEALEKYTGGAVPVSAWRIAQKYTERGSGKKR